MGPQGPQLRGEAKRAQKGPIFGRDQSCPRVGWTRESGHDFAEFWRIGSALRIFYYFTDYLLVPESI